MRENGYTAFSVTEKPELFKVKWTFALANVSQKRC
jgi:hypothetical protein